MMTNKGGRPWGPVKVRVACRVDPQTKVLLKAIKRKHRVSEGEACDMAVNFAFAVSFNAFESFCEDCVSMGVNDAINEPSRAALEAMKQLTPDDND